MLSSVSFVHSELLYKHSSLRWRFLLSNDHDFNVFKTLKVFIFLATKGKNNPYSVRSYYGPGSFFTLTFKNQKAHRGTLYWWSTCTWGHQTGGKDSLCHMWCIYISGGFFVFLFVLLRLPYNAKAHTRVHLRRHTRSHSEVQTIHHVTFKRIEFRVGPPVAFSLEGTPARSLYGRFSCFNATQSLLFPLNDQAILMLNLRLNRCVCRA